MREAKCELHWPLQALKRITEGAGRPVSELRESQERGKHGPDLLHTQSVGADTQQKHTQPGSEEWKQNVNWISMIFFFLEVEFTIHYVLFASIVNV